MRRFEFVEQGFGRAPGEEPGFREFLEDASLSGTATGEELAFLARLGFTGRRPLALYDYRALKNLRDLRRAMTPDVVITSGFSTVDRRTSGNASLAPVTGIRHFQACISWCGLGNALTGDG